jgi:hypothetical protein
MRMQISHTFECDPALFWEVTFDEPFNDRLYRSLEMIERTVLDKKEDDATLRRKIRYVPKQDMPAVIQKLMSGQFSYVEDTVYQKGKDVMDVTVLPSSMGDKITFKGQVRVRSLGAGRCERSFDAEVTVKIMMVGGTIEKHVGEMVKKSYDKAATLIAAELKSRRG